MPDSNLRERRRTLRIISSAGEQRVNILGVSISAITMTDAIYHCDRLLQSGAPGYICVTGVHGIMEAQYDERFRSILNSSFLTTPDGAPTVWVGRCQGFNNIKRVSGPEFMLEMCNLSIERGYKHFFFGGKPGVAEDLKKSLQLRFPDLQIVGTYTPPFRNLTEEEEADLHCQLLECKADILWCGISTPKQERFMSRYCGKLPVKLMVGVGAAFDVHSGHTKDAPKWIKEIGMHWFFRMMHEPKRLAARYLKNNPTFMWKILLQMIGARRYHLLKPSHQKIALTTATDRIQTS